MIANATTLCILSPVLLILLGVFAESQTFHITEGAAAGIGCTVLFLLIASAVFMFITCGVKLSHLEHFENELFETEYGGVRNGEGEETGIRRKIFTGNCRRRGSLHPGR